MLYVCTCYGLLFYLYRPATFNLTSYLPLLICKGMSDKMRTFISDVRSVSSCVSPKMITVLNRHSLGDKLYVGNRSGRIDYHFIPPPRYCFYFLQWLLHAGSSSRISSDFLSLDEQGQGCSRAHVLYAVQVFRVTSITTFRRFVSSRDDYMTEHIRKVRRLFLATDSLLLCATQARTHATVANWL